MSSEAAPPARKPSRKSPAVRSQEIRDAACSLARDGGLNALTLRAIAAEAGVSSGLVAHYQPAMDDLIAATFTTVVQAELREISQRAAAEPTATDSLRHVIATVLEPHRGDVTVVWLDAWSMGRRVDAVAAAARAEMEAWQDLIRGLLERGVDTGEFVTDDPDAVAWHLVGMIDGLNAQSLVRYRDAGARARLIGHAIEHALGLPAGALISTQ